MKLLLFPMLLALLYTNADAQIRDTTKTKNRGVVVLNPNTRRNGYETFSNSDQIVGAGTGPTTVITIDHRYEGLRGTPYFLPAWHKGQIEMTAGQNYTEVPIKFDAFRQHLILLRTWVGNDSIIVNADQVKSFRLNDNDGQSYLFKRLPAVKTDDETLKEGYFLVLYQGKSALLKRVLKRFKQADYKDPYSTGVRYDSFKDVYSYYILKPDQTLSKIKLSQKALLDSLGDHKNALKAYVKAENLSVNTEADAVLVMKQYDSL
ncbi:hypothetical protein [Spirosoma oryzicola]|uniref:hypothetical protein n=1 Tax=Spirosoma oryzicola TaxID=2898794 RepID=UPI001E4F482C|nr:hypothetical protein [Spirosoma oryzicola]UHG92057.1 hypothetical protein LQ777_03920 [Spirosoma oryzicola]